MGARKLLILFLLTFLSEAASQGANAQACTTLGQTPPTAFPVCGTSVFMQATVPSCVNNTVPTQCTDNTPYTDKNPFWYKFTCFTSGTLGFLITPNTNTNDYDWELFDITGHNPADVYTVSSLFVCDNWSSNSGPTGATANGSGSSNCAGPTYPNQSAMPTLIQGHQYLLMVSHYTDSQSGYGLSFGGGTASITDTTAPAIAAVQPICDGSHLSILLNKNMTCSSLAADGSDFVLTPSVPGLQVTGASSVSCSSGFDMDSLTLTLNGPLPPGNYTLTANNGTDGNTLLDNCGTPIPVGQSVAFTMTAPQPTPLDSLTRPTCAPAVLQLVFSKKIQCSTIAADGSDFTISGPVPVTVTGASGNCDASGATYTVFVNLAVPIQTAGNFTLHLVPGSDGNTLIDVCDLTTPAATLNFFTKDTVSAALFTQQILGGCRNDTVELAYPSKDLVNQWQWVFDGTDTSRLQDPPEKIYPDSGSHTIQLIVSNGFCSDTANTVVSLENSVNAKFEAPNITCPKDYVQLLNNSSGVTISSWNWEFGDGTSSNVQSPPDHLYPLTGVETKYTISLIVANDQGCSDTARQQIDVLRSCFIAVPSAFTPNGDGLNDYLYPLNAFKAENLVFRVYNRNGQLVFESNDWTKKWDGTVSGHAEPAGTFVWMLQYTDGETGKRIFQKGTTVLIR